MKIKYLGTAAAEGVPALFCKCETCKKAKSLGGKEIRTRSQALIDGKLMIDFPADSYSHALNYGIELSEVYHYLITHTHSDHLYIGDVVCLAPPFAKYPDGTAPYHFYGGAEMAQKLDDARNRANGVLNVHTLEPFKTYDIAEYKVTPLKANHGTETPFIYIIESADKRLLYAHDTGIFPQETMEYLIDKKPYFNFVSWDCCSGNEETINYTSHLCMGYIKDIFKRLEENGIIDADTKHCVNHFSHGGKNILYSDRKIYEKEGYIMSYDGLEIEF